jgi:hypothetical protein
MKFVCTNCFADEEINNFISSQKNIGNCSFCKSKDVETIDIVELFDFFNEVFSNFKPKLNGKRFISIIQENWNLFEQNDVGILILNYIMEKLGKYFKNAEEMADFNDDIIENVNYWEKLKFDLKWNRRYLTEIEYIVEDLGWDSFFSSQIKLNEKDQFYRARLHSINNTPKFKKGEMYCPPKEMTTAGRANPLGIPYLYLCDNVNTTLYEIRASYLDEISIGTFKLNNFIEDITISDFTEIPSLYIPGLVNRIIKSTLLKREISKDLSKPIRRYDSEIDYVPTQFICEFIKEITGVYGLKFGSSLHREGNNIVIFDQKIMKCTKVEKVKIQKVILDSDKC